MTCLLCGKTPTTTYQGSQVCGECLEYEKRFHAKNHGDGGGAAIYAVAAIVAGVAWACLWAVKG